MASPRRFWQRHRSSLSALTIGIVLALTVEFWCNPIRYVQVSLQTAKPVPLVAAAAAEAPAAPVVMMTPIAAPFIAVAAAPKQAASPHVAPRPRHVVQKSAPPKPLFSLPSIR